MQVISLDFSDDDGSRSTVDDNSEHDNKKGTKAAELGESDASKHQTMSKNTMNFLSKEMSSFKHNLQQLNTYFLQAEQCVQTLKKLQETNEIYIKLKDDQDQTDKQRRDVIKTGQIAVKSSYAILQQLTATLKLQKDAQEAEWETHPELKGTYTPAVMMQENLIRNAQKRFIAISHCFSEAQVETRQMLQSKAKRLLQMVNKDISDEYIDECMQNGNMELLQDVSLRHNAEAQQILEIASEKYQQSAKINDLTLELKEMSANLLTLLVHQSDFYDRIEEEIIQTRHNVQDGVSNLRQASEHAKKAKCCICCSIVIFIIIVLIVLLITLGIVKSK